MINTYEEDKIANPDHVATPRWVVESIYNLIGIKSFKNIWFPFNNYDSQFKLYADSALLPRRGSARRPSTRIHADRPHPL